MKNIAHSQKVLSSELSDKFCASLGFARHSGERRNPDPYRSLPSFTRVIFIPGESNNENHSPWTPACAGETMKVKCHLNHTLVKDTPINAEPSRYNAFITPLSPTWERAGVRGADILFTSSPRRKPGSRESFEFWIPASAGMTEFIGNNHVFLRHIHEG